MLVFLYMAALFAVMSPGVFVRFPKNCSKLVAAATHGAAFVVVFWLTHKFVMRLGRRMGYEGFQNTAAMPPAAMPPTAAPPAAMSGARPMPGPPPMTGSQPSLAAMNVMISIGSGKSGNSCGTGNDCASGMCMSNKCL
jgi:hypothetical protein